MKRKSKSFITGGLLGLAGLGLLPRGAEAATDLPAAAPDPSLAEALAENPSPVIAPEPSAQATVPQVEEPQPAWSPEDEQSAAIAAASAITPLSPAEADGEAEGAIAVAELAIAPAEDRAAAPEPTGPAVSPALEVAPSPAPVTSAVADHIAGELANLPVQPAPAAADVLPPDVPTDIPAADLAVTPQAAPLAGNSVVSPAAAVAEDRPQAAIAPPAEPLPVLSPQPAAAKPLRPTAELTKPAAAPAIAASPRREVAPVNPPANAAPAARPTAPDLATLRARGAAVQGLMRDLRAAAGLDENATVATPTPSRRVSQPEALRRGPQLPQLPSDSARRRPLSGLASQPTTAPATLSSTAGSPQPRQAGLRPGPQRPLPRPDVSARATDVALALPAALPVLSPAPAETISLPSISSTAPTFAQTPPAADAAQIRDDLQIAPLTTTATPKRTFPPSPNAGIPSGFGANWGDVFVSASLSGADRIRPEADGSLSAGFGLGDSRRAVGVELNYNLLSVRRFGENGGFDAKIHRQVYSSDETQVAAAVGLNNFASYGPEAGGSRSSLYGVVTAAHLLQPEHPVNRLPITGTLGLGGGSFSGEGSDVGVIAGVGLQIHPQFSLNTAWSGVGVNVGASIAPVPTVPLTLNLLYGDIGNNTQAGSVAVLSIGYGFNFGPRF